MREAVSPLDVIRWALSGQLPYMRLGIDSREAVAPFRKLITHSAMTPKGSWRSLLHTMLHPVIMIEQGQHEDLTEACSQPNCC
jgi:hypothetical protein